MIATYQRHHTGPSAGKAQKRLASHVWGPEIALPLLMKSQDKIISEIQEAFFTRQPPSRFTIEDGDPECMEKDAFLKRNTPETILRRDLNNWGWDPLTECLPEAIGYFLPSLVKFSITPPHKKNEWYGSLLLESLGPGCFYEWCNPAQKCAIAHFMEWLITHREHLARLNNCWDKLNRNYEYWNSECNTTG